MFKMPHVAENLKVEAEAKFAKIYEHACVLGVKAQELASLDSVRNLSHRDGKETSKIRKRFKRWLVRGMCWAFVVKLIFVSILVVQWPVEREKLVSFWFQIPFSELTKERCLMGTESSVPHDLLRPPVDCSVCRGVTNVDRVFQISPETFEVKYAYTGRPVIITDAMDNWTAMNAFNFEFFRGIYSDDSPVLAVGESNCQFFPFKTNFRNLSEVFHMSNDRARMTDGFEPWYIGWSNCDSSAANVLRTYYTRPYFLPEVAESSKTDWIFMGSPGYGAHLHIDNVMNPSWQAQVTGSKLWVLKPPPECYFECPAQLEVLVRPGEIIVLDTNRWYHSTQITGSEMSITIGSEYD